MAERAQPLTPLWPNADALLALLDELRLAGYNIGIDQYVAVQDLLLALAERGEPLVDPRQLHRFLGPLLCSNATEQSDFQQRFTAWLTRLGVAVQVSAEEQAVALDHDLGEIAEKRQWLEWWGLAALALVIGLAIYIYLNAPTTDVQVSVPPRTLIPTFTPTAANNGVTNATAGQTPLATKTPVSTPTAESITTPTPTLSVTDSSPTAQRTWWELIWPILVALGAMFAIWQAWWFYQARQFLVRRTTATQPDLIKVALTGVTDSLFATMPLLRLAQEFRRRISTPSADLDVERTLSATLAQGGWFTPVYGSRLVSPEYLVLVDRTTYRDQQASFVNAVIEQLAQQNVYITTYYFEGDPRLCFSSQRRTRPLTLPELANQYSGQRLLLFADAERLFSPVHGGLEAWIELFSAWPRRALMTPEPPEHWGQWEQEVREHFAVLPASAEGLAHFVRSLQTDAMLDDLPHSESAPLPSELRTRPRRWLQRDPVASTLLETVLADLRRYLGVDGYYWLSACAVYPELHWNLTLYLGQVLQGVAGQPLFLPQRLLALARLPWFRYGFMSDWLRTRLVADLSHDQERRIRTALQTLLASAVQGEASGLTLTIARRHRRTLAVLSGPLLRLLGGQAPVDSPLRDFVFVNFMAGWWRTQLAVRLPLALQRLLGEQATGEQTDWWAIGRFGWSWFLTNLAGTVFSVIGCVLYVLALDSSVGVPGPSDSEAWLFTSGFGAILAFLLSNAQQITIRRSFGPQLRWVFSSMVGGAIGGGLFMIFYNYFEDFRTFNNVIILISFGLLCGLIFGTAQRYASRQQIPRFTAWVWANMLGFGLIPALLFGATGLITNFVNSVDSIILNNYLSAIVWLTLLASIGCALYSLPTGIVLYRAIVAKRRETPPVRGTLHQTLGPLSIQAEETVSVRDKVATVVTPPLASADKQTLSTVTRDELIAQLSNLLALLYSHPVDIRRIVNDAGFYSKKRVAFSGSITHTWHNVLLEADRQGSFNALLTIIMHEYPENSSLQYFFTQFRLQRAEDSGTQSTESKANPS